MKVYEGCRDGKSAKISATRNCLYIVSLGGSRINVYGTYKVKRGNSDHCLTVKSPLA